MHRYYVNKKAQDTGEHEVHQAGCSFMPKEENRLYLGIFASCHGAVREAAKTYRNVDGCSHCGKACHKI